MFFYNPLFELYRRYKTHFNDFFLQCGFYIFTFLLDKYLYGLTDRNVPIFSLAVFIILFLAARLIIRHWKLEDYFGPFAKYGPYYGALLGVSSWLAYLLFARWKIKFSNPPL